MCLYVAWQRSGTTPLYIASQNGHVAVVEALMKAGAALNQATVCDCMPSCAAGPVCGVHGCLWGSAHGRAYCEL